MATSTSISCAICAGQSVSKPANKWCSECDEAFCSECIKYHSIAKATRNHAVIDVEHYRELPAFIFEIEQHCDTHNVQYQIYCPGHECPCCIKCIDTVHKMCNDLIPLDDVIKDTKFSTALEDFEERLQDLQNIIQGISKETEENMQETKARRKSIEADIKQFRVKINKHLDNLEDQLLRKLDETENFHRNHIEQLSMELRVKEDRTKELLKGIASIKQHASNLQVFLATKEVEVEVMKEEKGLEDLSKSNNFNTRHIFLKMDTRVQNLLTEVKSFGEIDIKSEPINIVFLRSKDKQAQIAASLSKDVNCLNLTLKQELVIPKSGSTFISRCVVLGDRKMLCLEIPSYENPDDDETGNLVVLNEKGCLQYKVQVSQWSYDFTCIDDKTIAVISSLHPEIQIVNLEKRCVERIIKLQHVCYGIAYIDGKLLYNRGEQGLEMRCLTTDKVTPLKMGSVEKYACIAVYNNRASITSSEQQTVTCYNMEGMITWKWNYAEAIKGLSGITVDTYSNVYVAGGDSNNIIVISSDGKQSKSFVPDTTTHPRAIYYDKKHQQLLICSEFGNVGLFSVI